jgi:hypothetical protein
VGYGDNDDRIVVGSRYSIAPRPISVAAILGAGLEMNDFRPTVPHTSPLA